MDILRSMHLRAFNPEAPPPKGSQLPGGLFINWRGTWDGDLASAAEETNIETTGLSDEAAGTNPRHDAVTDLIYLRNLYAYRVAFPADRAFEDDISRIEPIVRAEFATYTFYRAWLYFQYRDLDRFDPDHGWDALARNYVAGLFARYYDPSRGRIIDSAHQGYRTDYVAETAAALLDAGRRYSHPEWTAAGRSAASYLIAEARNPATGLIPFDMVAHVGGDRPGLNLVKVGAEAQLLDALLTAYDLTHDAADLEVVRNAVDSLYRVSLRLWDAQNQAFFYGVNADGSGLKDAYRETRQAWMLPLLEHLGREQAGDYSAHLQEMLSTLRDRLWQPMLHGYPYRVDSNFNLYTSDNGPGHTPVVEDFVTSEAMDIACEALQSSWPIFQAPSAP